MIALKYAPYNVIRSYIKEKIQKITMKKLAFLLGLAFVIFLIPQAMAYDQSYYLYNTSSSTDFSISGNINVSAGATPNSSLCITDVKMYANINSTGSYSYRFYLYINNTLQFQNDFAGTGIQICMFLGNMTVPTGFLNATARAVSLGSPVPVTLFLEFNTRCESNDTFIYLTSNSISAGQNMYRKRGSPNVTQWYPIPNSCEIHSKYPAVPQSDNYGSGTGAIYFVPFNSKTGNVTLEYNVNYFCSSGNTWWGGYFRPNTNTSTQLFFANPPPLYHKSSVNLEINTNYVQYAYWTTGTYNFCNEAAPIMNVTINDYTPNYVCGNWSACEAGYQTRICIDTKGGMPNQVQSRSCLAANQTIVMGFEDFTQDTDTVKECNKYWYLIGCGWFVENRTVWQPDNPRWNIIASSLAGLYVATVTQSDTEGISAPLGSRFLKMWYMPPYWAEHPTFVNATWQCYNFSGGTPSWVVYENINSSFFASYDFTFPSPSMSIYFDVRKCPSQVVQYDTGFWCGKACYGNCTAEPKGNYWVGLLDITNDTWVLRYDGISIAENWTRINMDVTNIIQEGHQYRLYLAVEPPNSWYGDPDGYCSYFDRVLLYNAQYSTKDEIALDLFGKLYNELTDEQKVAVDQAYCSTPQECKGNDLYIYTLQNDVCVSQVYYNHTTCIQQQQAAAQQSLFQPISSIAHTIVNTTTNQTVEEYVSESGFGFTLVFLTPIFWVLLFTSIFTMLAAWITKHMEIGITTGLLILLAFTLAGYFPAWLFVILIVIGGYIVGRTVVKAVTGGG